jgi:hypothetical protein
VAIEKEIAAATQTILDSHALRRAAEKDLIGARAACSRLEGERGRLTDAIQKSEALRLKVAMNPNAPKDTGYRVPLNIRPPALAPAKAAS